MELVNTLAIIYWIGYAIVFTIVLSISAWAFANSEELEKEEGQGFSMLGMLVSLIAIPTLSWIFIIFTLLSYYFQSKKSN